MRLTLEGATFRDILLQMKHVLRDADAENISKAVSEKAHPESDTTAAKAQGPGPEESPYIFGGVDNPVDKPVDKPRTAKQLENDERLRARAAEKAAAKKTVKPAAPAAPPEEKKPEPETKAPVDPAELVKIRQKTIEDLQSAYANGYQKEVFELLSRFGNGAKSFRELPPDAFLPIREAIDMGALT